MNFRDNFYGKAFSVICSAVIGLGCILPTHAAQTPNTSAVFQSVQLPCQSAAVHYSAGSGSTVIGTLQDGTQVEMLEEGSNWHKVACGEQAGYIRAEQVAEKDGAFVISCQGDSGDTLTWQSVAEADLEAARNEVIWEAENHLGTPYVWGGKRPGGFDCSGFVYYVYGQMGYSMGYDAVQQLRNGVAVEQEELEPGDLVFFSGTSWQSSIVTHVGIYLGDGEFIHAANSGISVSSLDEYWLGHYYGARRVLVQGVTLHGIASGTTA